MPRFLFGTLFLLFAIPELAGQPCGAPRSVDPAVPHRNAAEVDPGIRLANGSLRHIQTDLETAGRVMGLCMRRTWRGDMDFDGPLGRGWTCEYLQAAWRDETTTDIYWHDADGFMHVFVERDGAYRSPPGVYVRATWDSVAVSLRKADGTVLEFNDCGQLAAVTDRNGNGITLSYDGSDQLEFVTDDRGESWEFIYDSGRIVQLIDHVWETGSRAARVIDYAYTDGNLVRVSLPETSCYNDTDDNRVAWEYAYDGQDRLTDVFAPNEVLSSGAARSHFEYDATGRVISFHDGDSSGTHYLRYTLNAAGKPLIRHIDPSGARVDYTLDAQGRSNKREQYTKFWAVDVTDPIDHAVVTQTADKVRASDPTNFVTKYDFNRGHELTRLEHPAGDVEEFGYPQPVRLARGLADDITGSVITLDGAEWVPGEFAGGYVRMGASLAEFAFYEVASNTEDTVTVVSVNLVAQGWGVGSRFVVFTENPDQLAAGNVLEHRRISTDISQPDIVRAWSYEPYFQQVRSETSARGFTTTWEFEFDTTSDPADGNVTSKLSPEVTILLPEGDTDTATYETSYTYNTFGQLAETTDAEGSVEVRHYYSAGDQTGFLEEIIRAYGVLDLTERFEYDKTGILTGQYAPAAFDPGADAEDFKTTWQVNALGQIWHESGRVVAAGERVQTYRYFDASGNEARTFRSYLTAEGDAPPAPSDVDDPNSFSKEATEMSPTWVEVSRLFNLAGLIVEETSDAIAANPVETVTWVFEYDALGRQTARVSPLINRTEYEHDERGLLWRRIEGATSAVEGAYEHDYDLNGLIAAMRTPLGHETLHSHDGHGREVAVIDPEGNTRAIGLDASDNIVSESCVDAAAVILAETSWSYDELERLNRQQRLAETATGSPIGAGFDDTRLTLDGRGAIVQSSDGTGRTWTFAYDAAGRLVTQTDPIGNEVALTLNAAGDATLVEFSDWNQQTEAFETSQWEADYSTLSLAVSVRDRRHQPGFDTSVNFLWDGWGRLVRKTDAAGVDVEYTYDLRSRQTSEQENPGGVLFTGGAFPDWDRDDRDYSRRVLDDPEQATLFDYDERNRVTSITRPDDSSITANWDADSNLTGWEDENGTTVSQEFDGRGLVVSRTVVGLESGADAETYEYDGASRLTSSESLQGGQLLARTERQWNTLSRPESSTLTLGDLQSGELGSWTATASYDQRGWLVGEGYSDSDGVAYTLDVLSRVAEAIDTSTSGTLASFLWAGPSRVASISLGNGIETSYEYEDGFAGPFARIQHSRDGEVLWAFDYLNDRRGLPSRERRDHDGLTGRAYAFHELRNLTGVHLGADLAGPLFTGTLSDFGLLREFSLDMHGSRTGLDGVRDADNSEALIYAAPYVVSGDGMNRYASADGALLDYDSAGQVELDAATGVSYAWDYRGRMVTVDDTPAFTSPLRELRHDAQGRRVLEDEYEGATLVRRTVLVYGASDQPLEEIHLDAEGLELGRMQYAPGPQGSLAERENGAWRYHHAAQDGSLIGLTEEGGKRVAEYDYLPFGAPVRRAVMLDVAPGEITDCESEALLSIGASTHICLSVPLTPGALAGRELAIAVPGAASNRYRTAAVLSNDAESITVDDPDALIADAIFSEGAGFLIYEARLSTSVPTLTYESLSDSTLFEVTGADFSPWLLGGWLTIDVTRPAHLDIIEVDEDGDWLRVRGDATGMADSGDHYRALPPVGVDTDGGYSAEIGGRYLYRGYRHDAAVRLPSWPDSDWANRSGSYSDGGRKYDPRLGRWLTPAETWRNPYEYAPDGNLGGLNPLTGAPGLRGTWSPSLPCPTQPRGRLPSRFAGPVTQGWSG